MRLDLLGAPGRAAPAWTGRRAYACRWPWPARLRAARCERGGRLDRWIRDLAGQSGPDAALQDRIFLDTLLRPRLLDFLLPRRLARRLPRRRRRGTGGLLAALALGAGLQRLWQQQFSFCEIWGW